MKQLSQMTDDEYAAWYDRTGGRLEGPRVRQLVDREARREQLRRLSLDAYYRNKERRQNESRERMRARRAA